MERITIKTKEHLNKLKKYPLSTDDIQNNLDENTNIFTYPQLHDMTHIDEIFDRNGRAIMLFMLGQNYGHWIAITKHGNTIEVYDPYGIPADKQDEELGGSEELNRNFGQDQDKLKEMIKNAGYKLISNKKKSQGQSQNINTCGRHSVLRLLFSHLNLNQYNKMLSKIQKQNANLDDFVTVMTHDISGV